MKKTIRNRLCGIVTGAAAAVPAGMLTVFAEGETSTASTGNSLGAMLSTLALPVLLIVFLYFVMFRPQQKQEKETEKMQRELQIGDEVVTIGGIVGFVLRIEEPTETVVLESARRSQRISRSTNRKKRKRQSATNAVPIPSVPGNPRTSEFCMFSGGGA